MSTFRYQAIRDDGEKVRGRIEAADRAEAMKKIKGRELYLFDLEQEGLEAGAAGKKSIGSRKKGDVILFTRELADLLEAGITLGEALQIVSRLLKPGGFQQSVEDMYQSLKGGLDFSECLAGYPEYFPPEYINMVRAGEEGGFLALTCRRLARNLEERARLQSFITSSLIYPAVLLAVATLAITVMLTYVLPKFQLIYSTYGQSLPGTTNFLLQLSHFLSNYGLYFLLILTALVFGLYFFHQTEQGKRSFDSLFLRLPFFNKFIRGFALTELSRSIGTMLQGGVPLLKALNVGKFVTGNLILQEAITEVSIRVKRGGRLSSALQQSGAFPEVFSYLVGVGEETGKLGEMLLQVADKFETDSKELLASLMRFFEPALILLMGGIIGFIVISMLLPVLKINTITI